MTQANLASTICRRGGYTTGIRPPTSVTGREKAANATSYGYTGSMNQKAIVTDWTTALASLGLG
ncbi:hypothetical protein AB0M29_37950 [Streptomyces sp. NPDC051976]|uniref:hypothetical protein n=1 Tax=Streptomyces sp. NPDC051976 TaxID=3154947 RepID=UPI00342424BA